MTNTKLTPTPQALALNNEIQRNLQPLINVLSHSLHSVMHPASRRWIGFLNMFGKNGWSSFTNAILECVSALHYDHHEENLFDGWELPEDGGSNPVLTLKLPKWSSTRYYDISLMDGQALAIFYLFSGFPSTAQEFLDKRPAFEAALTAWHRDVACADAKIAMWMD